MENQYTQASTNLLEVASQALELIDSGLNVSVVKIKNADAEWPVKIKNPALDNPFNWSTLFGVFEPIIHNGEYFNETEKMLTEDWVCAFGTPEAIELYQQTGLIKPELAKGMGTAHVMPYEHWKQARGWDGERVTYYAFQPANGLEYNIVDESVEDVYVIVKHKGFARKSWLVRQLAEFLDIEAE